MNESPQSGETQFFNAPKTNPIKENPYTQPSTTHPANESKKITKISQNLWGSLILGFIYVGISLAMLINTFSLPEDSYGEGARAAAYWFYGFIFMGIIAPAASITALFTKIELNSIKKDPSKNNFRTIGRIAIVINLIPLSALLIFIIYEIILHI